MNKKIVFSLIATLSFGLIFANTVNAEEGIMPISETAGEPVVTSDEATVEGTINPDDIDDSIEPTTIVDTGTTTTIIPAEETNPELEDDIDHNGTSDEALVVCADANEPGCEDEEVLEPEMWTLYISLGALGVTVLLVIIINLIGHHKK